VLTIPFALAKDKLGTPAALVVLVVFLVIGLVLTLFINERRGVELAMAYYSLPSRRFHAHVEKVNHDDAQKYIEGRPRNETENL